MARNSASIGGWCNEPTKGTDTGPSGPPQVGYSRNRRMSAPIVAFSSSDNRGMTTTGHGPYANTETHNGSPSKMVEVRGSHEKLNKSKKWTSEAQEVEDTPSTPVNMTTGRERRSSVSTINHHNAKLGWQNESNQTDDKKSETGKSYWTQTMESMDLMNSDHKPAVKTSVEKKKYAPVFKRAFHKIKQNKKHEREHHNVAPLNCVENEEKNNPVKPIQSQATTVETFVSTFNSEEEFSDDDVSNDEQNDTPQRPMLATNAWGSQEPTPPQPTPNENKSQNMKTLPIDEVDNVSVKSVESTGKPKRRKSLFSFKSKHKDQHHKTSFIDVQNTTTQGSGNINFKHSPKIRRSNTVTGDNAAVDNVPGDSLSKSCSHPSGWVSSNESSPQVKRLLSSSMSSPRTGVLSPIDGKLDKHDRKEKEKQEKKEKKELKRQSKKHKKKKGSEVVPPPKPCFGPMSLDDFSSDENIDGKDDELDYTDGPSLHNIKTGTADHDHYIDMNASMSGNENVPAIKINSLVRNSNNEVDRQLESNKLLSPSQSGSVSDNVFISDRSDLSSDDESSVAIQRPRRASLFNKLFAKDKKHDNKNGENDKDTEVVVHKAAHKWKSKTKNKQLKKDNLKVNPKDVMKPRGSLGETVIESLNNIIKDMDESDNETNNSEATECQRDNPDVDCQCIDCLRLEAELEAERERHQREMQERLNDERKQADLKLQDTVEKAHQEMDVQKSEYEQRLEELQFKLDTYRSEVQHTEHDRQKSKHLIDKLEREKLSLETEVRSNRKRLEDEVEANAKAISEIPSRPSAIIALVQKEQERISRNLESLKMRRTPRLQTPLSSRATRTPKNDLYKRSLVLREANRISQFLKKNTVFTFEEVSRDNGETQTCVKVTNTTLGVSTYWTLERFNFRLNEMREMYRESDGKDISSPGATCQVFYNHNDQWQKEERLKKSPSAVPQMVNGIEKMSPVTATAKRLSLGGTPTRKLFDTSGLDDSTLDASCLNDTTFDISSVTNTTTSIVGVCKDLMSIALEGYQGSSLEESVADKMLSACHTIKTTIPQLCNCYTHNKDDSMESDSPDSDTIRVSCIQIQMSLTAIMSHSSSWPQNAHQPGTHSHGDSNRSRLINLMQADVHKLASQFVLLLQGLENDIESMIEKCCAQITQDINALCQHIGELSAATDMSVSVMIVNNNNSGETNSNHNNNIDTVELDEQSQNICTEVRESFQDGYSSFLNCAIHEEDSNYFDNSSLSNSTMNNTLTNRSMDTG